MSKLAKFFGAAVFLISVVRSEYWDKSAVLSHLNDVKRCIYQRATVIKQLIGLSRTELGYEDAALIQGLRLNITEEIRLTGNLVNEMITQSKTTFNETKCRGYFLDYKKQEDEVLNTLEIRSNSALQDKLERLRTVEDLADKALLKIEDLKRQAASRRHRKCFRIVEEADRIQQNLHSQTNTISCTQNHPSNAMNLILETERDLFMKRSRDIALQTYVCINNGPPHLPHHHPPQGSVID